MWFWYALTSALISGVSVTFNKRVLNRGVHSSIVSMFLFAFSTVVGLYLLISTGWGKANLTFSLAVIIASFLFAIGKTLQLNIIKQNNLSNIYPLSALSPLMLYFISLFTLQETIKYTGVIGIFVMVAGVYLLNFKRENKDLLHPLKHLFQNKFSLLYMIVILLSCLTTVAEKTAINNTLKGNIFFLAFWENLLLTFFMAGYVLKTNKGWLSEIKSHLPNLTIAGILYASYGLLLYAGIKDGPIALVTAIKKFEVFIVLVISYLLFKERPSKYVYIGVFLMLIAVILIKV